MHQVPQRQKIKKTKKTKKQKKTRGVLKPEALFLFFFHFEDGGMVFHLGGNTMVLCSLCSFGIFLPRETVPNDFFVGNGAPYFFTQKEE